MSRNRKWKQIDGSVQPLDIFGGGIFYNEKTGDLVKVYGPDPTADDDQEIQTQCEYYECNVNDDDPINREHVKWLNILGAHKCWLHGEPNMTMARTMMIEMTPMQRVIKYANYMGWHEFHEPQFATPGYVRRHVLRGALNMNGEKI